MILFFKKNSVNFFALQTGEKLSSENIEKLKWLFGGADFLDISSVEGFFVGPRREMVTPWSTNAVEITQNMGLEGIVRIEEYVKVENDKASYDAMLQRLYNGIDQNIFTVNKQPEPIVYVDNLQEYNQKEGLALNDDEISYLEELSKKIGRKLTDSEIFGFSQVNSEHCRHKIFNGSFIIDGEEKEKSLFQLIKKTTQENPNTVVSAYKDNCAFMQGPVIEQFSPETQDKPDEFVVKDIESVISLKAETHNFPTTVEPFNGAATGTGGEIRDRIAGGKAAFPIAGTAVYMTSYPRPEGNVRDWEKDNEPRPWLYQTPEQILIKASNGASDFGNKFGQPVICGSLLTFEYFSKDKKYAFDKVVMQAGGIGFAKKIDSEKAKPSTGDKVVLLGGDNYRIGMGGGAVSSVATGEYKNSIELNAVQRSNPEMQKRVYNAIRALGEADVNPIVTVHDHGAGGHLNCLSELVEETGGEIYLNKLPIGDPTLSAREIIGNESQERMGLILKDKDTELLKNIAERERSPFYVVGKTTGDKQFTFVDQKTGLKPLDLKLEDMIGNPPKTIMVDHTVNPVLDELKYDVSRLAQYLEAVLQLESVACKDWLTNKVDRSVTGKIAKQQCCGEVQLPLNDVGAVSLDYKNHYGIATSLGHAPACGLIDPKAGSVLSIAEALTNIVWAPLTDGLKGVSLSANWMWPCKNEGEDARLYQAVQAASDFAISLGINIPTGKDSLSMTQKYKDDEVVFAPGTVIISAAAQVNDIRKIVEPVLVSAPDTRLIYIDFSNSPLSLGGSAFAQVLNQLGNSTPQVKDASCFSKAFQVIQQLIADGKILAGHDISAGGLITALLEMNFANTKGGLEVQLDGWNDQEDIVKLLFSENPGVLIQVKETDYVSNVLKNNGLSFFVMGKPSAKRSLSISRGADQYEFDIDLLRDKWFKTSYLLERKQSGEKQALARFENYKKQDLRFKFKDGFTGTFKQFGILPERREKTGIKAAIIREKGVNGDREMAYSMYLAGFDVKDVHMTDLISGRETLEDVNFIVFVGGFSNSDVLGSAKGWAGAFLYNEKAKLALDNFYKRDDTLSLGVCNGCQLMVELGLITPDHEQKPRMLRNESHKFESEFINVEVPESNSVILKSLKGSRLGIWVAHGEGKFSLPYAEDKYHIALKYSYDAYPGNPNGSDYSVAGICSADGRHLAMMPHLERSVYPWQWAHYPSERKDDQVAPWIEAFVNAVHWVEKKIKKD